MPATVLAAGGVLWRPAGRGVEVALVHRPRYDDWSLPKGKLQEGEDAVLGALREVLEETGFAATAGRHLGTTTYDVVLDEQPRPKAVQWWAMRAGAGAFVTNDEVDELRWCPPQDAAALLTADRDAEQVRRVAADGWDLRTSVLVRHGAAGSSDAWPGEDAARPLSSKGRAQAAGLAEQLVAFGIRRVLSAPPLRCVQTVTPLAERIGCEVEIEPLLGDEAHGREPGVSLARLRELLALDGVVVCSQGGALPDLLATLARESGIELAEPRTRKGAAWVLSLRDQLLVAADPRPAPH